MNDPYMKRTEYTIERTFTAPPARLWRAFTDPEELGRWIWAGLGGEVWAEVDLRVGGAYRVYTKLAGGRHHGADWSGMCGIYVDLEPERRLIFTLHWDADVGYNRPDALTLDEVVRATFEPDGDGTRMTFTHLGIPDDGQSASVHRQGEEQAIEVLARLVEGD
jgi:uncharacterized protein YndB with AHSA1/START domain